MAHLLGHPGCMESLRADLRDLQAAIADVSSRAGAVRFPSWKFPDVSCDLDLAALLEQYSCAQNDPEFAQHCHVVLLELPIDRLLLLLQTFTGYAENLLSKAVPPARAAGPSMSAGLTARRYWSSMLQLGTCYQQLLAEKKACRKEIPTLQAAPQAPKLKQRLKHLLPGLEPRTSLQVPRAASPHPSSCVRVPDGDVRRSSLPRALCSPAESSRSVPMQTTGPSLGPCTTCASAQASLRQVGRAITSICRSQNIPSALSHFQETVEDTTGRRTLSATHMSSWASEQSKDLSRISKHLHGLLQQVTPLKAQLEEAQKEKDELQKQVEDLSRLLQEEKETERQRKEAVQSLKRKNKEHSEAVARLERDKDDLRRGAALLEERLSAIKQELAAKQMAVQELEVTKATLLEERRSAMVARSRVLELEEKVQLLSGEKESLGQELSTTNTQLELEKARVESVLRHQEALWAKQRALLWQLDSLDQERQELQVSLEEAQEDKAQLAEQLEESQEQSGHQLRAQQELLDTLQQEKVNLQQEKVNLQQSVSELQANVSRLEEQAQELKQWERLLVSFPELHIPAEMQFESTGSMTEDMEKQLQANTIWIGVLEQENVRLRSALAKVKAAAEQGVLKLVPQTQLRSQLSSQRGGEKAKAESTRRHQTSPARPQSRILLGASKGDAGAKAERHQPGQKSR
ncbi:LOW QUALITY PROTEIN: coiled-coil domain-containing protein 157-like [Pterocles gutturalis]